MNNFIEELKWRGMLHDVMPGTEELLKREKTTAYIGFDPTADSLHIGHLTTVMMLKHFQLCGHKPIVLVGGATGMIGDPSGKSAERNLLDEPTLRHNQEAIKKQFALFLDFDSQAPNAAEMVNNYDWMKDYRFLDFTRDVGKHITVNYMMSKDSVKKRITGEEREGMSFTEFTYQLVQGYDYLYLYEHKNCKLQMGGSDQWGNITTGTELIRRKTGGEGYALTCPLITKADGGKFGKTEQGNVWIDPRYTSPYAFYQFWLNTSDDDAQKYIKIFTLLSKTEIEKAITQHLDAPHERTLQKLLAKEITTMVHGSEEVKKAENATFILFGQGTSDMLRTLDEATFLSVFDGVPLFEVDGARLPLDIIELLAVETSIFPSKGECRKMIQGGGLSLNKEIITTTDLLVERSMLFQDKYLLIQKGKKNYFIIKTITL
ncbi:MAG: tyrosine--tRNA ligase [Prevotellaceae bacterium]|jgi:tyrosyl-tRNA synthetase|nr:tyrosine--tRNA ligase [Prevotellaceae bacterium]